MSRAKIEVPPSVKLIVAGAATGVGVFDPYQTVREMKKKINAKPEGGGKLAFFLSDPTLTPVSNGGSSAT
jgi:hypothetical protein